MWKMRVPYFLSFFFIKKTRHILVRKKMNKGHMSNVKCQLVICVHNKKLRMYTSFFGYKLNHNIYFKIQNKQKYNINFYRKVLSQNLP
jgi:hypothetical protein